MLQIGWASRNITPQRPALIQGQMYIRIGRDAADPKRLAVVIWAEDREGFPQAPEELYANHTIRVTGHVEAHEGMLRIEVTSPDAIEIVK